MGNKLEPVIRISLQSYSRGRALLPKKLANESINHFKDNWREQGFDDNIIKPWKARKGNTDPGRAILVKSGRLRRSFDAIIESINRAKVINSAPYGIFHNYGTSKLPQRKFMGVSRNLDEKCGVLIMRMIKAALR
jgi:phage gpG-like protein